MERKIGEIFEYNGEWYQCVEGNGCENCAFCERKCYNPIGDCCADRRKDNKDVIFKKLEKVGEPYIIGNKLIQRYKIYPTTYCINVYGWYYQNFDVKSWTIDIEIKQNKEDMEEKKLNLKPFDIQKAREGKPVCLRNGKKARIICFDVKNSDYPIIALVENGIHEAVICFNERGITRIHSSGYDLMMAPERKTGWINLISAEDGPHVYCAEIYPTEMEAIAEVVDNKNYITTIQINWEE